MEEITINITEVEEVSITVQEAGVGADRAEAAADAAEGFANTAESAYNSLQPHLANVDTVAGNIGNVNTVAGISGDVTTVAGISGNVTSVAGNETNINKVAAIDTDVTKVANIDGDVSSVAGNEININTVAANNANVTAVGDNIGNVNSVAANEGNINAVNTNEGNINTVASNIGDVQTVSTNIADVNFVAGATIEDVESTATTEVEDAYFGRTAGTVREGDDWVFGDFAAGNYSEFEADGTLKFHGDATVFRDEMHTLLHQSKNNASARMVDNIAEGSLTYKDNATVDDYAIMSIQLNHDRKNGADVYPHLHWWQTTANMPNWLIEYRWQRNGEAKVTDWTELEYTTNAFTYVSGTLNQITRFTAITPPSGDDVSDILQIRLSRDVAAASTVYSVAETSPVDQDAVSLDVHIEIDTVGSRQEYIK